MPGIIGIILFIIISGLDIAYIVLEILNHDPETYIHLPEHQYNRNLIRRWKESLLVFAVQDGIAIRLYFFFFMFEIIFK